MPNKDPLRTPNVYEQMPTWPGTDFTGDPGLTRQSELAGTDIETIVNTFARTGVPLPEGGGPYMDLTLFPTDYKDIQDRLAHASQRFDMLDAFTRASFNNDWTQLLEAYNDPEIRLRAATFLKAHGLKDADIFQALGLPTPEEPRTDVPKAPPAGDTGKPAAPPAVPNASTPPQPN